MKKPFYKKRYPNVNLHQKSAEILPESEVGLLSNFLQTRRVLVGLPGQLKKFNYRSIWGISRTKFEYDSRMGQKGTL
jgi:hypothetical protein